VNGPAWLSWLFSVLMVASAVFHTGALVAAGRARRPHPYDVDLTHLVMSTAMAAMLVLPFGAGQATTWSLLIAVPAGWFALRTVGAAVAGGVRALGQPGRQLVMTVVMLFMLLAAGWPTAASAAAIDGTGMAGMRMEHMAHMEHMAGHGTPASSAVSLASLTLVAVLALVGAGLARELGGSVRAHGSGGWFRTRGPSLGCELAMTSAMGYMLVLMVA
jgi:Domain of unknown function (DUF5134)